MAFLDILVCEYQYLEFKTSQQLGRVREKPLISHSIIKYAKEFSPKVREISIFGHFDLYFHVWIETLFDFAAWDRTAAP